MIETTGQLKGKTPVQKPLSVQNNLAGLSVSTLKLIKQDIGRFMAYAHGHQLTKSVDIKTKLDNAES